MVVVIDGSWRNDAPKPRMSRRRLLTGVSGLAGGVAIASLLSACGVASSAEPASTVSTSATLTASQAHFATPSTGSNASTAPGVDKLVLAWWTDVGTMSPFQFSTTGPGGVVLLSYIFDTLTWKDEKGVAPWLGTKWEASPDGLSYTFLIAGNALWHDGEPLTSDDVAFSFGYYADHPFSWMSSSVVLSAKATNDSITISLAHPAANFLEEIAGILPIIPRHVWETVTDPIKYTDPKAIVGSGPYVMSEHDATAGAYRLTAFGHYWNGTPRAREVQQITIPKQTELQMVRTGQAQLSQTTDASVIQLLANDATLKVAVSAPLSVVRLAVNTEQTPLDRKEVRQAIMYALDRATIARTITKGPAITSGVAIVPPGTPWFNPDIKEYPFDLPKAKELLGGERITLDLLADPTAREPELMAPMLASAGITINIKQVDVATRLKLLSDGDFQLALTGHIGIGGDPDYLRRWYAGEEANAFARGSIFKNPDYARLGEQQAAELDPVKRKAIVFQMQEILAEELPTLVLYHRSFYWIYDSSAFTPFETWGGLMNGIPFPNNKLTLLRS